MRERDRKRVCEFAVRTSEREREREREREEESV